MPCFIFFHPAPGDYFLILDFAGIGCVIVQNSTHYGIAGYYATMATQVKLCSSQQQLLTRLQAGCVGFSTTNARPSIAVSLRFLSRNLLIDSPADLRRRGNDGHQPSVLWNSD